MLNMSIIILINYIFLFKTIKSLNIEGKTIEKIPLNNQNPFRKLEECNRQYSACIDSLISSTISNLESIGIQTALTTKQLTEDKNFTISLWEYPYKNAVPNSITQIDFGEGCGLNSNNKYILMVIEYFNFTSPTNFIYFKLYQYSSPNSVVSISSCSNNITMYTPIDSSQFKSNLTLIELFKNNGVNVFDYNDDYFHNVCNNLKVDDSDYVISDRLKYFYIDYNFCQEYCFLTKGIDSLDFKTKKGICSCQLKAFDLSLKAKIIPQSSNDDSSDIGDLLDVGGLGDITGNIPGKEMLNTFTDFSIGNIGDKFSKKFNYKVVKCVKLLSKWENYKENFGFWVSSSVFILLIVLFIIYITISESQLMGKIEKVVNNNKKTDVPNPANPTQKGNSNDNEIIINENNGSIEIESIKDEEINQNKPKYIENKKENKDKDPNLEPVNNNLEDNKEGIIVPKEDNPNEKPPEGDQGEKIEIKMYENDRIFVYLNMTFTQACDNDKRNPFIMIWDTFVVKVRLMNVIFIPQAFGVITMEISILLFSIIMDFTFNAFLFGDDTISKVNEGNGKLDFFTSWIIALISGIISRFLTRYVVGLTDYKDMLIFFLLESTTSTRARKFLKEYVQKIKKNLRLYLILELVLMVFYIFYLTLFGALYKNSQNALFISYIRGLITYIIYTLLLIIIIVILRIISIKSQQKYVYYTSRFILQKV